MVDMKDLDKLIKEREDEYAKVKASIETLKRQLNTAYTRGIQLEGSIEDLKSLKEPEKKESKK
jgi:hypothetical protein